MIRNILTVITVLTLVGFTSAQDTFKVKLSGQIFNFPEEGDSFDIVQNKGNDNKTIATIDVDEEGVFKSKVEFSENDYYLLKLPDDQQINLIIEGQDEVKVYGDGDNLFTHSNIIGSESSTLLNEFLRYNTTYKAKLDSANQYLKANPDKQKEVNEKFKPVFQEYQAKRQRFIQQNPESPALVAVLSSFDLEKEFELYEKVVKGLESGFGESPTVQNIVQEYENNKEKLAASQPLSPGSEVEDIEMPNPEGDTMKLSDYKGKVVLIDFWASWCGPCRKENPNVVKLYEKYKDDGFEVFSVSLDKDKDRWVNAIEQDNLKWEAHVSDLKYWNSAAAKKYNVSSIPYTVLIDEEGKVINTRLRGPQLEAALESIYGH
ncbi:MAG: TlpA disulfide reductase family protein [Brumimicrobium sp.]